MYGYSYSTRAGSGAGGGISQFTAVPNGDGTMNSVIWTNQ